MKKERIYIGARYVPIFKGEWDIDNSYESLSIVSYNNNSYTSKKNVPIGIDINDKEFWSLFISTGDEISEIKEDIDNLSLDIEAINSDIKKIVGLLFV